MQTISNYINGQFVAPINQTFLENINPATGKVYSKIPDSQASDVELAVQAAEKAFEVWSQTPSKIRSNYLLKIAELISKNIDEFALAECIDNGKPLWMAKEIDIPRAASNFEFFATAILHFASESHSMDNTAINYTLKTPIGVVGCISPWNLPLYLFTWKIAPALAAGNCVIAKPSEVTPMTAYMLAKICDEAQLPKGVLNIIHGLGQNVGNAITSHKKIKAISFTGGTQTGATIAKIAAPMFKKLSLELGGKNPNIIFADCDFDLALKTTIKSSFNNQGQICLCGSRIFIEKSIYHKFKDAFVQEVSKLKVGSPTQEDTKIGALVSEAHLNKVLGYVDLAKAEGGSVLCGGNRVLLNGENKGGFFMEPTVIEGLNYDCRTNQEEIFGPIVTLTPFTTEDEVLTMANSTPYGLAAIIWTNNLQKAHKVAHQIEAGIVWINCWMIRDLRTPFGGIKNSGIGREGGFEALKFFTETKNICLKL